MAVALLAAWGLHQAGAPFLWTGGISLALTALVYWGMTRKLRLRERILAQPFPPEWETILQQEVLFFRALPDEDKPRFRREIQVFLGEKRITGIGTDVDTETRVLIAAGAIIPIFGFPEWEWDQIREVLVYPDRFNQEHDFSEADGRNTLGMVGSGAYNGMMILSKPDVIQGFRNFGDKRNVAIHEFAHLLDKSDGAIDGLPAVGMSREAVAPWVELVRREMHHMLDGDSDINPYGLTNEAEFFAVVSEYFFERPGVMQRKHPELYAMLARFFNQSLADRARAFQRERKRGRVRLGRNAPCPCGSGKKYKECCLKRSEPGWS
ncbi:MAG: zinc-dependent peptidase [Bryobacterales bacterium]|nr:zinc-dependent peptidase [Acidobacteriota bacterium]MCB9383124.1 zinc-dependent peptidase [Bryobacterales bacterium]